LSDSIVERPLEKGDILSTWCGRHKARTEHIWTTQSLTCLICFPSYRKKFAKQDLRTEDFYEISCATCNTDLLVSKYEDEFVCPECGQRNILTVTEE